MCKKLKINYLITFQLKFKSWIFDFSSQINKLMVEIDIAFPVCQLSKKNSFVIQIFPDIQF